MQMENIVWKPTEINYKWIYVVECKWYQRNDGNILPKQQKKVKTNCQLILVCNNFDQFSFDWSFSWMNEFELI